MEFRRRWLQRMDKSRTNVKGMFREDPCAFCKDGDGGTLDHILPRHKIHGHHRGVWTNYTGACPKCNFDKGSGHFLIFFAMMQGKPVLGGFFSPKAEDQFDYVPPSGN